MRLVADDEVERTDARFLRGGDDVDRLVGGEDHRHRLGRVRGELLGQPRAVGRRGVGEVVEGDVGGVLPPLPLADLGVRADGEGPERNLGVVGPLAHGLRHQRERGDHEEDGAAPAHEVLGDAQRGEGLARAAGKDQLAAIGLDEARAHRLQRLALMGTQRLLVRDADLLGPRVVAPLDGARLEVAQPDALRVDDLARQRLLGSVGPVAVAGVDDEAAGEARLARGGEEAVDVAFVDLLALVVELALHGAEARPVRERGDEVDAAVGGVLALHGGPVGVGLDLGELRPLQRIMA